MPIYIIPVLVAIALTIVTVGVGLLVIHGVYGEVDLEDVKILIPTLRTIFWVSCGCRSRFIGLRRKYKWDLQLDS